ncbi:hypothetical protein C2E23DRAFT_864195 [Lenzites betulinus]|nr:hypothetical protein C2E23DRAFT_864195 [Lenzites betulinus]
MYLRYLGCPGSLRMVGAAVHCSMERILTSGSRVHARFQAQVVVDYSSDDGRVQEQVLVQIFIESLESTPTRQMKQHGLNHALEKVPNLVDCRLTSKLASGADPPAQAKAKSVKVALAGDYGQLLCIRLPPKRGQSAVLRGRSVSFRADWSVVCRVAMKNSTGMRRCGKRETEQADSLSTALSTVVCRRDKA